MKVFLLSLVFLALSSPLGDKERLRAALKDNDLVGTWIYDDLEAGLVEAGRAGRPLLVVIRCVP
jgi:serine protease Do